MNSEIELFYVYLATFSDSQLRPVVEAVNNVPRSWYVNCTPGGSFWHVAQVFLAETMQPKHIGTNNMAINSHRTIQLKIVKI